METIIHKIKLKDIIWVEPFRDWVLTTDYAACHDLASVQAFEVLQVSDAADAPFHFIEIIHVSSHGGFEQDMQTPLFASLVERFEEMAEVLDELHAVRIGEGYSA